MGKKKYRASRDLPEFIRKHKTTSPSELAKIILNERNTEVTEKAVSMWFLRHPKKREQLEKEIIAEELPQKEVTESIFQNGTFEELDSVKNWIQEQQDRDVKAKVIQGRISALKRICQGHLLDGEIIYKHPDRLNLEDSLTYLRQIREKIDTAHYRQVLRDFLESKGEKGAKRKIRGGKPKSFGKYAHMHVEPPICQKMIDYIETRDKEIAAVNFFMWKTGTRIAATLNAEISEIKTSQKGRIYITVYDKGRKSKYPRGHPWNKYITPTLWEKLKPLIGNREKGKIFNADYLEISKLNREALNKFCPKLKIHAPNHFWRHMFFQHILRKTEWNISLAAALGGSTTQSVEESYGQPPDYIVEEMGEKYMTEV